MRFFPLKPSLRCIPLLSLMLLLAGAVCCPATAGTYDSEPRTVTGEVRYAGGVLQVSYKPALFSFSSSELVDWIGQSARAVTVYFGRFPVKTASLAIEPAAGPIISKGSASSAAVPHIRLDLGRATTGHYLARESVLVHEMTHLAMPVLPPRYIWLHEGIATYVEHVARAQAGQIDARQLWATFVREMPKGLPDAREPGGLDGSVSIGRRYWGGAMFCLLADVEIRRATDNRMGLQDALRAVQREGGNLSRVWSLERTLSIADRGTGKAVLRGFYQSLGTRAVSPDLGLLWRELGVRVERGVVTLDDAAPLGSIRHAITHAPSDPLLITHPQLVRETADRPAEALPPAPALVTQPKMVRETTSGLPANASALPHYAAPVLLPSSAPLSVHKPVP